MPTKILSFRPRAALVPQAQQSAVRVGAAATNAGPSMADKAMTTIGGQDYSTEVTIGTAAGAVAGFFLGGGLLWSALGGVAANLGGRYFAKSECEKNGGAKCATQPGSNGGSGSGGHISTAADGSMSIAVDPMVDGLFSDNTASPVPAGAVLAGRTAHLLTPSGFTMDALIVGYDTHSDGVALQLAKLPDGTPTPLIALLGGGGPSTFAIHRAKLQSVA